MHKLIPSPLLAEEEYGNNDHCEDSNDANNEGRRARGPCHGSLVLPGFLWLVLCHALLLYMELSILALYPGYNRLLCLSPRVLGFLYLEGNSHAKLFYFPS